MSKVRKQLYLDAHQERKLREYAARWGCSEAGVIRIALDRLGNDDLTVRGSPEYPDDEDDNEILSDEEIAALEREVDEWAEQHPEPLGLSEAVSADREGR